MKKKVKEPSEPHTPDEPLKLDVKKEPFNYPELLKHPKWQRKRLEIMNRDNFKCVCCGDEETTLHIHHKNYEYGKNIWEYEDNNFITVCEDCHIFIEGAKKEGTDISAWKFLKIKDNQRPEVYYFFKHPELPGKGLSMTFYDLNKTVFSVSFGPASFEKIYDFIKTIKDNQ